jgi:hypothetical protein
MICAIYSRFSSDNQIGAPRAKAGRLRTATV